MISNFDLLILQLSDIVQKCFVLQTELKIPPFKWDMAQPSSLFVGRDILQTILGTFFLGHPVVQQPCVWILPVPCVWILISSALRLNSTHLVSEFSTAFLCLNSTWPCVWILNRGLVSEFLPALCLNSHQRPYVWIPIRGLMSELWPTLCLNSSMAYYLFLNKCHFDRWNLF